MAIVDNSSIESKTILQSLSLKIGGTSSLYKIENYKVHSIIFHMQYINLQKNTTFKINARSIRFRAHRSPHSENTLSTYTWEAGAATKSSANGARSGYACSLAVQNDSPFSTLLSKLTFSARYCSNSALILVARVIVLVLWWSCASSLYRFNGGGRDPGRSASDDSEFECPVADAVGTACICAVPAWTNIQCHTVAVNFNLNYWIKLVGAVKIQMEWLLETFKRSTGTEMSDKIRLIC